LGFVKSRQAVSTLMGVLVVVVIAAVVVGVVIAYSFLPGNLQTQEFNFEGFTEVDVGGAFQVTITQGSSYSIVITADERIFDDIEVTQTGNTLSIGMEPGIDFGIHVREAEIVMPTLQRLVLSGATKGTATGFNSTNTLRLNVSGASSLQVNNVYTGNLEVNLSGASTLTAQGSGDDLEVHASGASNSDLTNFPVNDAFVDVSGASQATVNLTGILDVQASGASSVHYIGEPTLGVINTSGASTVNKR